MSNQGDLRFTYFVIGLGLGLLGGVLFAPRAGDEIRHDARRRANEGLDYLSEQADKLRDATEKLVNTTREWMSRRRYGWPSAGTEPTPEEQKSPI